MEKICQSCGMPISQREQLGTNKDKSRNQKGQEQRNNSED